MTIEGKKLTEQNKQEGERLTKVIKTLGLSYNQFAQTIRVSKSLIVQFCNGKRALQSYHFLLISLIHNVSERYLREGEEPIFLKKKRGHSVVDEIVAEARASYGLNSSKKNVYFNELIASKNKIIEKNEKLLSEKDKRIDLLEKEISKLTS